MNGKEKKCNRKKRTQVCWEMHQRKRNWDRRRGKKKGRESALVPAGGLWALQTRRCSLQASLSLTRHHFNTPHSPPSLSQPPFLFFSSERERDMKRLRENEWSGGKFALPAMYKELGKEGVHCLASHVTALWTNNFWSSVTTCIQVVSHNQADR